MPKKLTLIRHGALDSKLDGCYVGRLDVPLSAAGKQQAHTLAKRMQDAQVDALWCSPALRAKETAQPIAERLQLDCCIVDELIEVDFGRWEGLTFEQISAADPELVTEWAAMNEDFCFPEGESQREFWRRVNTIAEQISDCEHRHLALVSHGGVIRRLLCLLLGWPQQDYLKIEIARGGFATLSLYSEGAVLTGLYNE